MQYFILCLTFIVMTASAQAQRLSVVELFTSQGCASCPPADQLLGELNQRDDVLALSYHVDYWDYIGWKDPYAHSSHSAYQKEYADKFGLRYVYTPQMVVNGKREFIGTQKGSIISIVTQENLQDPTVTFDYLNNQITVRGLAPKLPYDVEIVRYLQQTTTTVQRGENRGKTLQNFNSVIDVQDLGQWQGGEVSYAVDPVQYGKGQAILIRHPSTQDIVAAFNVQ